MNHPPEFNARVEHPEELLALDCPGEEAAVERALNEPGHGFWLGTPGADQETRLHSLNDAHGEVLVKVEGNSNHRLAMGERLISGAAASVANDEVCAPRGGVSGQVLRHGDVGGKVLECVAPCGRHADLDRQLGQSAYERGRRADVPRRAQGDIEDGRVRWPLPSGGRWDVRCPKDGPQKVMGMRKGMHGNHPRCVRVERSITRVEELQKPFVGSKSVSPAQRIERPGKVSRHPRPRLLKVLAGEPLSDESHHGVVRERDAVIFPVRAPVRIDQRRVRNLAQRSADEQRPAQISHHQVWLHLVKQPKVVIQILRKPPPAVDSRPPGDGAGHLFRAQRADGVLDKGSARELERAEAGRGEMDFVLRRIQRTRERDQPHHLRERDRLGNEENPFHSLPITGPWEPPQ